MRSGNSRHSIQVFRGRLTVTLQSNSYPPSADLRDIIARTYAFNVPLPDRYELTDRLLSETAFIRILLRGDWSAEMAPGDWRNVGPIVFFGPNSKPLNVKCIGSFHVVGIAIRPSGWRALFDEPADKYTDQMIALGDVWGKRSDDLYRDVLGAAHDEQQIISVVENHFREIIMKCGCPTADPQMQEFERIARDDSTMMITDIADQIGLSSRQFERNCTAHFGMSPKRVLRRSRFLDMAAVMRGFSNVDEKEAAALRFTDQSHLNREFKEFVGMTPGQFTNTPTPLLTAGLELRSKRKNNPELF